MNIAWVKAGRLLPVDTGGKLRSYNLLRQLARRHRVSVLTYYDGPPDASYATDMAQHFPGAVTLPTGRAAKGTLAATVRYAGALLAPAPFAVEKWTHPAVQQQVDSWMQTRAFDVIICDFLAAAQNFPARLDVPTILFQHNVETEIWRRQASVERHPLRRAVYRLEARKMERFERDALRRFHHILAVSEHDRTLMSSSVDASRVTVVPTGVDVAQFHAAAAAEPQKPVVMYVGSMDWEANVDGVEWFCAEMWPRIRAAVADAEFRIVGRNPTARVRRLASESVTVTGSVPSIIDHLREAAVVVVPLRIGGGTRIKIFEAMGAARATVATSIGAEGLDVTHNENIMLHDDAAAFADTVVRLLQDADARRRLGAAGKALVARYDWSRVIDIFEEGIQRAITAQR